MRSTRLLLALALAGCAADPGASPFEVNAALSSAVLAEDCVSAGRLDAACEAGAPCPDFCQQTAVQLELSALAGDGEVPIEVLEIRLVSLADGRVVDTLSPHEAQVFDGASYVPWDSRIAGGESLDVRFPTDAPDWTTIGGGDPWSTHSMEFRVEVRLLVDGIERTIDIAPVQREAEIVT
jgi:hypothetical protein